MADARSQVKDAQIKDAHVKDAHIKTVWLWWSSGKDSAWALHELRNDPSRRVTKLVTTVTDTFDRVSMHGVRRDVLARQSGLAGLPLHEMVLSWPSSNDAYQEEFQRVLDAAEKEGVDEMAFGDLFLQEVREYREGLFGSTPIRPIFPLWGTDTRELSRRMVESGLDARVVCLDPKRMPREAGGRLFSEVLKELPNGVDPCGENGEMHTCVISGPFFTGVLEVTVGETIDREGFLFTDLLLSEGG